jgi:predicted rRNA methylase YqxC with S4 and FtsJ domains
MRNIEIQKLLNLPKHLQLNQVAFRSLYQVIFFILQMHKRNVIIMILLQPSIF